MPPALLADDEARVQDCELVLVDITEFSQILGKWSWPSGNVTAGSGLLIRSSVTAHADLQQGTNSVHLATTSHHH